MRSAGDPPSGDPAVDEAYSGVEATLSLYQDVFERASYDDRGMPLVSTVHYGELYDNAFWNGSEWSSATVTARSSTGSRSRSP